LLVILYIHVVVTSVIYPCSSSQTRSTRARFGSSSESLAAHMGTFLSNNKSVHVIFNTLQTLAVVIKVAITGNVTQFIA